MIHILRMRYPTARITLAGPHRWLDLAKFLPIDSSIPVDQLRIWALFVPGSEEFSHLNRLLCQFDELYWFTDPQTDPGMTLKCLLGPRLRCLKPQIPSGREISAYRYAADILDPAPDEREWAQVPLLLLKMDSVSSLWSVDSPYNFVFHFGSGSSAKCWPFAYFLEVVSGLFETNDYVANAIVGPVEEERLQERPALPAGCNVWSGLTIGELAIRMSSSAIYLGNDSGVSHLAGAVGMSGVVLFGPTNSVIWRPWSSRMKVLPFASTPAEIIRYIKDLRVDFHS
jgi:heptosyltransferase III